MRVLMITNLYPNPYQPNRGAYNWDQMRLLAKRHLVRVIAPILWTDELAARWAGNGKLPAKRLHQIDDMTVEYPRYFYTPRTLRDWYGHFFKWSVRKAFERSLREFRPDLVIAPWVYPDGWAAIELSRRANLPVIIKALGSDIKLVEAYPKRLRQTVEALTQADAVITVSQDLARQVVALGADPDRAQVIYNGVDANLFSPGQKQEARAVLDLPAQERIILAIGNLEQVKGHDVLIEACAALARQKARFVCYVIGQGARKNVLEKQADRLGIGHQFRFIGSRPQNQLPDWYRAADLLVLPSRSEGIPNVLMEALSCETPFVASEVGGVAEIAHFGASRLVPPDDPASLAEAIRDGLEGRIAKPAANLARSHAEAVDEMECLFDQVLRDCGRSGAGRRQFENKPQGA